MPAVLNGANEIVVASFLENEISFLQIPEIIEKTMHAHNAYSVDSIESVIEADSWAREKVGQLTSGDS